MQLRSLTFDELISRGVNRRFAGILTNPDSYHPDLSILIGKTNSNYFIPDNATDIVPLWDSNADSFVRWNRSGLTEYVWLFHDDPEWAFIAKSEQGIMAKLWQDWIEFQDSNEECHRFADAIGFRHFDEALSLIDRDYDEFKEWRRSLDDNVTS